MQIAHKQSTLLLGVNKVVLNKIHELLHTDIFPFSDYYLFSNFQKSQIPHADFLQHAESLSYHLGIYCTFEL